MRTSGGKAKLIIRRLNINEPGQLTGLPVRDMNYFFRDNCCIDCSTIAKITRGCSTRISSTKGISFKSPYCSSNPALTVQLRKAISSSSLLRRRILNKSRDLFAIITTLFPGWARSFVSFLSAGEDHSAPSSPPSAALPPHFNVRLEHFTSRPRISTRPQ